MIDPFMVEYIYRSVRKQTGIHNTQRVRCPYRTPNPYRVLREGCDVPTGWFPMLREGEDLTRKDVRDFIKKINEMPELGSHYIAVSFFLIPWIYEANSLAPFSRPILVSAKWIILLILDPSEETKNAFRCTVGHELTHKEGFLMRKFHNTNELSFFRWSHEVYCDFGAAKRMVGGDRTKMVRAINYKNELNGPDQKEYPSHPLWTRRKEYMEHYDFDDRLIDRIAEDTKCTNQELIASVKQYFEGREIHLSPSVQ